MLTLMAMCWNQQKFKNLATSLACRYQKVEMSIVIFLYCKYLLLYIFVGITFFFFHFLFLLFKATKRLESQLQDLESMRIQLAVTQVEVEGWVTDIKEWAEGESYTITLMSQFCRIMGDMLLQVITVLK